MENNYFQWEDMGNSRNFDWAICNSELLNYQVHDVHLVGYGWIWPFVKTRQLGEQWTMLMLMFGMKHPGVLGFGP